jgi:WD40 repeat protein
MFDRTNRRLVTGAHDGSIKLWNFSTGQQLKEFVGFGEGEVTGLACLHMTPYHYIIATGWNRKVSYWLDPQSLPTDKASALPTLQPQHHVEGHLEDILCMACYPELHILVTGSYDGDIILWNLDSMHAKAHLVLPGLASLKTDQKPIECMQLVGIRLNFKHIFPPKSKKHNNIVVLLLTASGDGVIRIWSTDDTAELLTGKHSARQGVFYMGNWKMPYAMVTVDRKVRV